MTYIALHVAQLVVLLWVLTNQIKMGSDRWNDLLMVFWVRDAQERNPELDLPDPINYLSPSRRAELREILGE